MLKNTEGKDCNFLQRNYVKTRTDGKKKLISSCASFQARQM